ncbi:ABC transporter substrate-binding protein [Bordetella bronchialis]|uniref:Peptide ABC transporter substrate-binding protein n=1 Tax=Bordetella bronchialis TaxID=463025 RepID=A0A193G1T1_9BORD|nr:ABC transporter substrate-binding protein [Bordetella bronchialis]ANN68099.1 peptide ABC transporter substrate-binding protein [Bordetella bronchialis]ANN73189.1 peptide ABC transporter substrate-binding protein [Bordetella bronchialis]
MNRRELMKLGAAGLGISIAGVPLSALAQAKKGGTLNVIVQPEPPGLMLGIVQNGPAQMVAGNIYEGLLRYDEKLEPHPQLATSWTMSEDGLTYTFKLKPDVAWHDGKPFTADDVVFSANVFLRKTHARLRGNLEAVDTITALDPLTVQFKLKYPFGPFLGLFENGSMPMVPRHIYEGTDFLANPANNTPIGTGPFKFKEWVKGSYIHLVANDKYHIKDLPLVDNVYFHVIPDAASRAAAFESGKVDIVPGGAVEFFDVARLAKLPGTAVTTKGWEFFAPQSWLWLNNRKAPMDNVKFRQAVMYAINREAMVKIAFQGYAKVATGPFNSHIKYYSDDVAKYPHDLNKARQLLAESGYKGEPLRLLPLPYGETWQRQAEIVRQNLMQAGVKIDITPSDVAGWNQRLNEWDYDIAFTYVYQYGDPALGVARNYTSSTIAKGSPFNNVEGYSNPKVDELFASGARAVDPRQRAEAYLQVQKILLQDVPVAWLHEIEFPTLYRTKVHDPVSSAIGLNDSLSRAWVG